MPLKPLNIILFVLGLSLVIFNNIKGYTDPSFAIDATLYGLPFIIALINFPLFKADYSFATIYSYLLILINAIAMWHFTGPGDHSGGGGGFIFIISVITLVLCTLIIFVYAFIFSVSTESQSRLNAFARKIAFATAVGIMDCIIFCWFW